MTEASRVRVMILSMAFILMSSVPISTVYSDIIQEFADSPVWLLDFMTVAPTPMMIAAMALTAPLLRVMKARGVSALSLALILVTGILPVFGGGIITLIISRSLVGLGCGLLGPTVTILSVQYFSGTEKERIMGHRNASQAFGSMAMFGMAMLFSMAGWRWAFAIYLLALPLFAVLMFTAPKQAQNDIPAAGNGVQADEGVPGKFPLHNVAFYAAAAFIFLACLNTLAPSLSAFLVQEGIAAGTASGIGMIVYMLGSFLAGMAYKLIAGVFRGLTVFAGMLITSFGIAAIALASGFPAVIFGCLLQGVGFSVFSAACIVDATDNLHSAWKPRVISIVMIFNCLGSFSAPFLADWVSGAALGYVSMWGRFVVAAAALFAFSAITLIYRLYYAHTASIASSISE